MDPEVRKQINRDAVKSGMIAGLGTFSIIAAFLYLFEVSARVGDLEKKVECMCACIPPSNDVRLREGEDDLNVK